MNGSQNKFIGVLLACIAFFAFYRAPSYALPEGVRAIRREFLRSSEQKELYGELATACDSEKLAEDKMLSEIPAERRQDVCLCMVDQGVTDLSEFDPAERQWGVLDLVGYIMKSARQCERSS